MKQHVVILANSIRPGGRCVAGISLKTGKWVRPVSREDDRAVPNVPSIRRLRLLDIVEVPLAQDKPTPIDRYQIENRFVDTWDWPRIFTCPIEDVLKYCEKNEVILHTNNDRVDTSYLDTLPDNEWKSLELVKARATFSMDVWEKNRWRVEFQDGTGHCLSLKVTDPGICNKLNRGVDVARKCLLTVSLAGPWAPPDGSQPERCYKLVAGVIEI